MSPCPTQPTRDSVDRVSTIRKSPTRPEPTRGPLGDYTVAAIQLAALAGLWGTLIGLTVGLVMALVIL